MSKLTVVVVEDSEVVGRFQRVTGREVRASHVDDGMRCVVALRPAVVVVICTHVAARARVQQVRAVAPSVALVVWMGGWTAGRAGAVVAAGADYVGDADEPGDVPRVISAAVAAKRADAVAMIRGGEAPRRRSA